MINKILKKTKERHGAVGVVRVFKEACDALAEEVNSQLFDGCRNWYWPMSVAVSAILKTAISLAWKTWCVSLKTN